MSRSAKVLLFAFVGVAAAGGGAMAVLVQHGVSARDEPTAIEAWIARRTRGLAMPRKEREGKKPVPVRPEVVERAGAEFGDHCGLCHGKEGRGKRDVGEKLYPEGA